MTTKTYTIYDGKILVNEGKKKTTYYYRTIVDGKRKKINLGNDRNLALQKLRELEQHGKILPKSLNQVWQSYSKTELLKRAPRTVEDYSQRYKPVQRIFGNHRMDNINPWDIVEYRDERVEGLQNKVRQKFIDPNNPTEEEEALFIRAGASANREIAIISILFGYAINKLKMKLNNPCNGIERFDEVGRDKYVEKNEYEKIYELADPILQDGLDLMLFTGLRISDMLKLKFSNIKKDKDLRDIHMPSGKLASEEVGMIFGDILRIKPGKTKKSTGIIIDLIIEGELKVIIDRILERRKQDKIDSDFLFADEEGKPISYYVFYNKYRAARKLAGFKSYNIQMRDLRHKNSVDSSLTEANARLGHSSITMTEKYRGVLIGKGARPITRLK